MNKKEKRIAIFGAGKLGETALSHYSGRVGIFIDNSEEKQGSDIQGIPIRSFFDFLLEKDQYEVVVATYAYPVVEKQLRENGVTDYQLFVDIDKRWMKTELLVFNPYENGKNGGETEEGYNVGIVKEQYKDTIRAISEELLKRPKMFELIEIETTNQCNGSCDFCPMSKKNHYEPEIHMSDYLFESVIGQLSEMDYRGQLALFCNNEPLTDPKILERYKYARKRVPNARLFMFTNGTLLTMELFLELFELVDEMIIDNYQENMELIRPCREIVEYCKQHPEKEIEKKVTIVLRNPHEILSSRGGDAPNRTNILDMGDIGCLRPFHELIVKADGNVPLCCNDPFGKCILGDAGQKSLMEIWEGERFVRARKEISQGRGNWKKCEKCDFLSLY